MRRNNSVTTRETTSNSPAVSTAWQQYGLVTLVAVVLFIIRLAAPPNLLDQDQERPAAYVLDTLKNGHWLWAYDLSGDVASKPPFYTWLVAGLALLEGRLTLFSLYLPGALGVLGSAWLLLATGRKYFNARAALFGALASILTSAGIKALGLARTDAVFAFTVTAAAFLAWRAWNRGHGWLWFWLAAAIATLTKGPLGLVLAAGGLLACAWERKSGEPLPLRGSQWAGVGIYFLLTGGLFYLAYRELGPPLIAKVIGKELVGQALAGGAQKQYFPGMLIWQQPLYYLGRAAPWSFLAYYGLWRIWKRPAAEVHERRFERFLFCWFVVGLTIFSIAPHQRADLLWPIMPAGALIAGRELARLTGRWGDRVVFSALATAIVILLGGFGIYYGRIRAQTGVVRKSVAVRELAAKLEAAASPEAPLTYLDAVRPKQTDTPAALQAYLNVFRRPVSAERAADLLRGPVACFVAVDNFQRLEAVRRPEDPPLFTVLRDETDSGLKTQIIGNRPAFSGNASVAFAYGPLRVELRDVQLQLAADHELRVLVRGESPRITITNESSDPHSFRVLIENGERRQEQRKVIGAQETWAISP